MIDAQKVTKRMKKVEHAHTRPSDTSGDCWVVDFYDGRGAWHLSRLGMTKKEAKKLARRFNRSKALRKAYRYAVLKCRRDPK